MKPSASTRGWDVGSIKLLATARSWSIVACHPAREDGALAYRNDAGDGPVLFPCMALKLTHASKPVPETMTLDLDRLIDNYSPAVHHMARRFLQSQNAAAELAQATLATAKSDPEAAAAKALDAYLFQVMHSLVLNKLGQDVLR